MFFGFLIVSLVGISLVTSQTNEILEVLGNVIDSINEIEDHIPRKNIKEGLSYLASKANEGGGDVYHSIKRELNKVPDVIVTDVVPILRSELTNPANIVPALRGDLTPFLLNAAKKGLQQIQDSNGIFGNYQNCWRRCIKNAEKGLGPLDTFTCKGACGVLFVKRGNPYSEEDFAESVLRACTNQHLLNQTLLELYRESDAFKVCALKLQKEDQHCKQDHYTHRN